MGWSVGVGAIPNKDFMSTDFSRADRRLLERPGGMARLLWRRYYRALRLAVRAEIAQLGHELMWGRPTQSGEPRGILNAGGSRLTR